MYVIDTEPSPPQHAAHVVAFKMHQFEVILYEYRRRMMERRRGVYVEPTADTRFVVDSLCRYALEPTDE